MTATGTASPVRANFPVRRMDFSFSETPKYWWDGQPFMTQFMNNLSSLFPYGEKFFVDSVRAVRDRLEDPQLKKDVSAFIGQEAMHSKEHAAYNEYAEEHGVDLECLELRIKVLLEKRQQGHHQETPVGDHLRPRAFHRDHGRAAAQARRPDHPDAVAEDVQAVDVACHRGERTQERRLRCVPESLRRLPHPGSGDDADHLMFFGVIGWFQLDLLRKDGQLFNWRSWKHGLGTLFGLRKGFFTRLLLPYLDYYRPASTPATTTPRNWRNTGRTNWPSPIEARLRQCRSAPDARPRLRFLFERRTGYCTRKSLRFDYRS